MTLPDNGGPLRSFKVYCRNGGPQGNDLHLQAHIKYRALDSLVVQDVAFIDTIWGNTNTVVSSSDTGFGYPYGVSPTYCSWIWVRMEVDSPGSYYRFYGCEIEYEVSQVR